MRWSKSKFKVDNFVHRRSITSFIVLVFVLVFLNQFGKYYDDKFVTPYLSKIPSSPLIAILFCLACAAGMIVFYYCIENNKKISNWLFFIAIFWFCIFIYCRYSGAYEFSPYGITSIKYADFVFVILASIIFLKIKCWVIKEEAPKYFHDPFIIDVPLSSSEKDSYQRKEFAFALAVKIQSKIEQTGAGALAIGINGEWGSGKTSFSNFIKEKLKEKNRVIIDFNPWRSSTPSKIIEDFFELLIGEIKKFDPALSDEINRYAKTLTRIDENSITKGIETISEFLFDDDSKNENYDKINRSIQKSNKQIIIFIDDLDRLDKREIVETLRLIRNTANFNSVVYVVSYDKSYVLEAVKTFNKHNYKNFLEKIFQFEFLLPNYDAAILRNEIKEVLKSRLGPSSGPDVDACVDYAGVSGKNITNRIIKTQRDVIRFINSLLFEIKKIKNEVNLIDFYFVQLLKVKFPGIYKFVADNSDLIFIKEKNKLRLRAIDEKNLNENALSMLGLLDYSRATSKNKIEETFFEEYIKKNNSTGLTSIEKDVVIDIVTELLKEKALRKDYSSIDYKSFVFVNNFHKYFSIQLLETDFSANEFEIARFASYPVFKEKIGEWIKQGRISDLQERLEKIVDFTSRDEWENHLKILVEIGKYQLKQNGPYGINYTQIIETLNYPKPKRGAIRFFKDEEEYHIYLKNFFVTAPDPYVFESNILAAALTPYISLHLTNEEIYDQLFSYFKKYCETHKEVTTEFRELHKNCLKRKAGYFDEYDIIPEAESLFRNHFIEYITGSQLNGFIRHTNPGEEYFHIDFEWINKFFPTWEDFEDFLEKAEHIKKEINHYEEFMAFYDKFKANNRMPIEFKFKYLQPNRWIGG